MDAPEYAAGLDRARWLAELAKAICDARQAVDALSSEKVSPDERNRLRARLIELGQEVESVQRGHDWHADAKEFGSKWIGLTEVTGGPRSAFG